MNTWLQTPIQAQQIQAVGITVTDVDRISEFYTTALGFEIISDLTVEDKNFAELQEYPLSKIRIATLKLGDEQIRLMQYLDIKVKPIPADSQSNDLWFQHLAIVVSDMDRAYSHLQSFGIEFISTEPQTIPPENKEAAYIQAFKFRDPDRHPLELIWFPPDKGQEKWHQKSDRLFLGIDHTAIAINNTEESLQFYRDCLGMRVDGGSFNWGETQAKLDGLPDVKVGITALRPTQGGLGIELLNYIEPANGRPIPSDLKPYDIAYVQVELIIDDINKGSDRSYRIKDPTGHSLWLFSKQN
ncbi:VOC family protein [Aerosakkonema sp. BLCC-F183]|uniref:VOC family protein n=1 Tax=Aerosakkonema sp. BLCC-F183 TaxID=3342834 RepID=UPI0035B6ADA2